MDDASTRYARHLALPEIGADGQRRLRETSVLVVGLGGLGTPAATYLAGAGIGRLMLNDFDTVDLSNLQRQPLYRERDVGRRKAEVAAEALAALNPEVECVRRDERLDGAALADAVSSVDLVLDCSDNFGTRFALNAACFTARKRLVSGAAVRLGGHVASFDFSGGTGPCYACLYDEDDETLEDCAGNGVLAPLVGVIGALQAVEAIRVIVGIGGPVTGRLLRFDAERLAFRESAFHADPACGVCGA